MLIETFIDLMDPAPKLQHTTSDTQKRLNRHL